MKQLYPSGLVKSAKATIKSGSLWKTTGTLLVLLLLLNQSTFAHTLVAELANSGARAWEYSSHVVEVGNGSIDDVENTREPVDVGAPRMASAVKNSETQITLTFDSNVATNGTNPTDFTVVDAFGTPFIVSAQADGTAGDKDIILTVADLSTAQGDLKITYKNNNNELRSADTGLLFVDTDNNGVTLDGDSTAPTMVSALLLNSSTFQLTFSEPVQIAGANPEDFVVTDGGATTYTVTAIADGTAQDTEIVITADHTVSATGDLTITYINNNGEVSDFGSNALATDATGVTVTNIFSGACPAPNTFQLQHLGTGAAGLTPATLNTPVDANGTWAGNYVRVNVVSGNKYNFSLVGSEQRLIEQFGHVDNGFPAGAPFPNISFKRPQVDHDPMITLYDNTGSIGAFDISGNVVGFNLDASPTETLPELDYTATYTGELLVAIDVQPGTVAYNPGSGPPNVEVAVAPADCSPLLQDSTSLRVTWIPSRPSLFSASKDSETQITAVFDTNVATSGGNPTDFTVTDGAGTDFPVSTQADGTAGDAQIILTVANLSSAIGDLTVTYTDNNNEISDVTDPTAFGATSSVQIDVDTSPPTLSSAAKDSDTQITVTLSEPVQTSGTNPTDFTVVDGLGTNFAVSAQADATANDANIVLTVADLSTAVGDLTVTYANNNGEISDFGGNNLATDATGVTIDVDASAPTLVSATKDNDTQITVTLSEVVQTNGTNPTDFSVVDGTGTNFAVSAQADGTARDTDIVLTVADLSGGIGDLKVTYTNNNNELSDFGGNNLATDATGVSIDLDVSAPTLVSATKDSDTQITVTHSEAVQTNGTNPSDFAVVDGLGTSFAVNAQADGTANDADIVLTMDDLSAAVGDLTVTYVNNNNEISDFGGNDLATDATGVVIDSDNTAPILASGSKESNTELILTFSEPIQTMGTNPTDFTVVDANNAPFVVSAQADGTANDANLLLTVADISTALSPLTVTYTNNNNEISDFGGNDLVSDATGISIEIPFTIVSASVGASNTIVVSFSQPIQTEGNNPSDFFGVDATGKRFRVSAVSDETTGDTDLSLDFKGLSEVVGNLTVYYQNTADVITDATTGNLIAVAGSVVVSSFDEAGPQLVSGELIGQEEVRVTFNEPVRINGNSFSDLVVSRGNGEVATVNNIYVTGPNSPEITIETERLGNDDAFGDLKITYVNNGLITDLANNVMESDPQGIEIESDADFPPFINSQFIDNTTISVRFEEPVQIINSDVSAYRIVAANGDIIQVLSQEVDAQDDMNILLTVEDLSAYTGGMELSYINNTSNVIADFGGQTFVGNNQSSEFQIENTQPELLQIEFVDNTQVDLLINEVVRVESSGDVPDELRLVDGTGKSIPILSVLDIEERDNKVSLSVEDLSSAIGDVTLLTSSSITNIEDYGFANLKISQDFTLDLDTEIPVLASAFAGSNNTVIVEFSEPVQTLGGNPADFTVRDGNGTIFNVLSQEDDRLFDKKIVLTVDPLGSAVGTLTLTYANNNNEITDFGSNSLATDATGVAIEMVPRIISATHDSDTQITLVYNQVVTTKGGNPTDFQAVDASGNTYAVSAQADGTAGDNLIVLTLADMTAAVGGLTITYTNNNNEIADAGAAVFADDGQIKVERPFIFTWDASVTANLYLLVNSDLAYNYTVDWGDGNVENNLDGHLSHSYSGTDVYTVKVSGDFHGFDNSLGNRSSSFRNSRPGFKDLVQWGSIEWKFMSRMFEEFENMTMSATDAPDLSQITDLSEMFDGASAFNGDIGHWDVSSITDMRGMFNNADSFNQNINSWDVSNVTDMSSMFSNTTSFNQPLDQWDVSNVSDMGFMFDDTEAFNQPIGNWNTTSLTGVISLFAGSVVFNQPLDNWDVSKVRDFGEMFEDSEAFNQDLNTWDTSGAEDFEDVFQGTKAFNGDISAWDVSNVFDFSEMFEDAEAFNRDLSSWDMSGATNLEDMFEGALVFNQDLSSWDVSNVTRIDEMFRNARAFNQDISAWDISKATSVDRVFQDAVSFNQDVSSWNFSGSSNLSSFFDSTATSIENYNAFLISLSNQNPRRNSLTLGAVGLRYSSEAAEARQSLIDNGWTITGDRLVVSLAGGFQSVENQIELVFSEPIEVNSLNTADFSVTDENDNVYTVTNVTDPVQNDEFLSLTVASLEGLSSVLKVAYNNTEGAITDTSGVYTSPANEATIERSFVTTWNIPTGKETFVLPLNNQLIDLYDFTIDWGDGNIQGVAGNNGSFSLAGEAVNFTKADNADFNLEQNQDRISNDVWITRGDRGGLFNIVTDNSYNTNATSIAWALGSTATADPNSYSADLQQVLGEGIGRAIVGTTLSLHLVNEDRYFDVTVSAWTQAANGGGFSYTRQEVLSVSEIAHEYASTGDYSIAISGDFPAIDLRSSNVADQLSSLDQWGTVEWYEMNGAFTGAANMAYNAFDIPDLENVCSFFETFSGVSSLDINLGDWDITNATDFRGMLDGTSLSIDNYDATLVAWAEKSLQNDVRIGVDGLNYCTLGENARQSIIDNHNWIFEGDTKNADCEPIVVTVDVPADGLYGIGEELEFVVTFDQEITISGTPVLPVIIGSSTVNAALKGTVSNSTEATVIYTVMEGDLDTDGISLGSLIDLNGGTIQNARSENAILTLNSIASTSAVLVDGVIPDAPVVMSISDDSGTAADDEITNDNTLSFAGTGEANATIEVFIEGQSIGTTMANASGEWTYDHTGTVLNDDTYEVTATATDAARNTSAESSALSVVVDTTPPAVPTLDLATASDQGISSTDDLTSGNMLSFEGTAEAGSVINIFLVINGMPSGEGTESTVTGNDGNWQISVMEALASGEYPLGVVATDAAGNTSDISEVLNLVIDQDLAISATSPADNETDVLPNTNLTITFDKNVVKGTGNITIKQVSDDTVMETIDVTGSNVTVNGAEVTIDPVDNILPPDTEFYVSIDEGAFENEAGASFAGVADNSTWNFRIIAASVVSSVEVPADGTYKIGDNLDFTVNMVLTVTVTDTPTFPITIGDQTVNATLVGTATNTTTLTFRYTVLEGDLDTDGIAVGASMNLNGGTMKDEFDVDAILTLNNVASTAQVFVDGVIPATPVVASISDDSGSLSDDELTNDQSLNFTGTAEALATVEVFVDGASIGTTTADASGDWTFDHTGTDLAEGTYEVTATATDAAGNISSASSALSVEVDLTAPAAPTLDLVASTDIGISNTDNLTSGGTLTIEGTAEAGSSVLLGVLGLGPAGDPVTADGAGNWSFTANEQILSGTYPFVAIATDTAGNESASSEELEVVIDQEISPSATSPADDEIDVLPNANLTMTFDKNVMKGTGNITIYQSSDDSVIETIDVTGGNVTIFGATVTIDPVDNILPPDKEFYVSIDAGAFKNQAGADYAGLTDKTTWSFTIIAASVVTEVAVPADEVHGIGDNLDFTVTMVLPVTITGTATIPITIGSSTVNATQVGTVSNSNTILFRYTILEGEVDTDGIAIGSAINLNGGTMRDDFGVDALLTLNGVASTGSVLVDGVKPTPTLSSSAVNLVNGAFSTTITYDEAVENVAASDLTVTNGTASNLASTVAGTVWTVDITPTADGAVEVSLAASTANDLAGNSSNDSNSISRTFDGTPPDITSVNRKDSNPLNTGDTDADFRIIFSEDVSGVDLIDLEVVLTGSATGMLNTITAVDAKTYDVNVNGIAGEGTIGLNVKDDDTIIDAATNPLTAAFTGQVYTTNFAPTGIGLSASSADENNTLTAVLATISTTDADAGDTHTYSLVSGTGDADNGSFTVDGSSLRANNLSFNFEDKASYSLRLKTDDGKGASYEEAFTFTVNDVNEVPMMLSLSNNAIDESDDAQDVGTLASLDQDGGETFTYSLVAGTGDTDNAEFSISGSTLRTAGAVNFEEGPTRSILVKVTDSGGLSIDQQFTINIGEVVIEPLREYETNIPGGAVRNVFSPNGDGVNETWVIEDLLDNPVNEVKVYAQGGKLIFSQVNYQNDWGGTFKGNPIPDGTYYYEINVYNGERIIKGFLTIIRSR